MGGASRYLKVDPAAASGRSLLCITADVHSFESRCSPRVLGRKPSRVALLAHNASGPGRGTPTLPCYLRRLIITRWQWGGHPTAAALVEDPACAAPP